MTSLIPKVDKIVPSAIRAYINRSWECEGKFEHHCGSWHSAHSWRRIAGDFSHSIYRSQRHSSLFPGSWLFHKQPLRLALFLLSVYGRWIVATVYLFSDSFGSAAAVTLVKFVQSCVNTIGFSSSSHKFYSILYGLSWSSAACFKGASNSNRFSERFRFRPLSFSGSTTAARFCALIGLVSSIQCLNFCNSAFGEFCFVIYGSLHFICVHGS